jgi:hypothetical protein
MREPPSHENGKVLLNSSARAAKGQEWEEEQHKHGAEQCIESSIKAFHTFSLKTACDPRKQCTTQIVSQLVLALEELIGMNGPRKHYNLSM